MNRAINGDIVAIQLLPESEWSAPANLVIEDYGNILIIFINLCIIFFLIDIIKNLTDDLEEENNLNSIEKPKEKYPTGQVVGIIRKKWRQYCGIIQHSVVENVS